MNSGLMGSRELVVDGHLVMVHVRLLPPGAVPARRCRLDLRATRRSTVTFVTHDDASMAHRFARAFNTRDVDRVVALFTDDAAYHDLFYGTVSGKDDLRMMFARMYAEGTRHRWTMTTVAVSATSTIGEWDFEFTISTAVRTGAGRTLRFPGVSVFDTRGGLCHTYREYFDRTAALLAVGIPPRSVAAIVSRRPTIELDLPGVHP